MLGAAFGVLAAAHCARNPASELLVDELPMWDLTDEPLPDEMGDLLNAAVAESLGLRGSPSTSVREGSLTALRVIPCALCSHDLPAASAGALSSASATHSSVADLRSASLVAWALCLARQGASPEEIRRTLRLTFDVQLSFGILDFRVLRRLSLEPGFVAPLGLACALHSTSFQGAVVNALNLDPCSASLAAVAGAMGEALHGIPLSLATHRQLPVEVDAALRKLYARAGCAYPRPLSTTSVDRPSWAVRATNWFRAFWVKLCVE